MLHFLSVTRDLIISTSSSLHASWKHIARYCICSFQTHMATSQICTGQYCKYWDIKMVSGEESVETPVFLSISLSTHSLSLCFIIPPVWLYQAPGLVNHCSNMVLGCRKWCRQAGVLGNEYMCLWEGRERKVRSRETLGKVSHTHAVSKGMCSPTCMSAYQLYLDTCLNVMHSQNDAWSLSLVRISMYLLYCSSY